MIPAYAGSTRHDYLRPHAEQDHPRIRGEHDVSRTYTKSETGSSPHTRGALVELRLDAVQEGIIPAYAGSTADGRDQRAEHEDHPRIRGEHAA